MTSELKPLTRRTRMERVPGAPHRKMAKLHLRDLFARDPRAASA